MEIDRRELVENLLMFTFFTTAVLGPTVVGAAEVFSRSNTMHKVDVRSKVCVVGEESVRLASLEAAQELANRQGFDPSRVCYVEDENGDKTWFSVPK